MLERATPEEQTQRDLLTFEVWGGGLTLERFLGREQRLRSHAWAAQTMVTWLWRDQGGSVLASCETFLDEARVGAALGTAATIASVFTAPAMRGRGHAAAMLNAVVARLAETPTCLAVTLFSEIGTGLYQRLGFFPVPGYDTYFPPAADSPDKVTWLDAPLPAPRHPPGDAHTLRLTLSSERLGWHLERQRCYGEALGRAPLTAHGARVGDSTISWTAYWKTNELQVLSLDVRESAHLAPLLHAARHAAHQGALPVVRVWETLDASAVPDGRRAPRTDEVAMFLPLKAGLQAWTQIERGLWA